MTIGKAIQRIREMRGMTVEEIAQKASLTAVFVYNVENGMMPSVSIVLDICDALDIPAPALFLLVQPGNLRPKTVARLQEEIGLCALRGME